MSTVHSRKVEQCTALAVGLSIALVWSVSLSAHWEKNDKSQFLDKCRPKKNDSELGGESISFPQSSSLWEETVQYKHCSNFMKVPWKMHIHGGVNIFMIFTY